MDIDNPASPPSPQMSTTSNPLPSPPQTSSANIQQQQALRALANGLTASLQSVASNMSNSTSANSLNQASLLAAASKLMELNANPVDDIVMQEITQRLVKMNQELWQQASVAATSAATGTTTTSSGSGHGNSTSNNSSTLTTIANSSGHGNHSSSSAGHGNSSHGHGQQSLQQQQQANELKLAEKLVNELAVQVMS